jgi:hypothetical protein
VAQSEIVHAFLEGTTCRNLVRELGHNPPVDSNERFDIATCFASGEEAVGAIFDGKKGKRVDDAPAEGSKPKEPQQKPATVPRTASRQRYPRAGPRAAAGRATSTPPPSKPLLYEHMTRHDAPTGARSTRTVVNSAALHAMPSHVEE